MVSPRSITGISICWIDSSSRDKQLIKETKEFMQSSKKYPVLYFTDEDTIEDISSSIYRYLNSDDMTREKIIRECN